MDLNIGRMPHGPRNSIADVSGVRVGHCTVDDEQHKTGVTVILPCDPPRAGEPFHGQNARGQLCLERLRQDRGPFAGG